LRGREVLGGRGSVSGRVMDIFWNYTFEQKYWWFHESDLVKEKAQIS